MLVFAVLVYFLFLLVYVAFYQEQNDRIVLQVLTKSSNKQKFSLENCDIRKIPEYRHTQCIGRQYNVASWNKTVSLIITYKNENHKHVEMIREADQDGDGQINYKEVGSNFKISCSLMISHFRNIVCNDDVQKKSVKRF